MASVGPKGPGHLAGLALETPRGFVSILIIDGLWDAGPLSGLKALALLATWESLARSRCYSSGHNYWRGQGPGTGTGCVTDQSRKGQNHAELTGFVK